MKTVESGEEKDKEKAKNERRGKDAGKKRRK